MNKLYPWREIGIIGVISILIILVTGFGISDNYYLTIPLGMGLFISYFVFKFMFEDSGSNADAEQSPRKNFWAYYRHVLKYVFAVVFITTILMNLLNWYILDPCSTFLHSEERCIAKQAVEEYLDQQRLLHENDTGPEPPGYDLF